MRIYCNKDHNTVVVFVISRFQRKLDWTAVDETLFSHESVGEENSLKSINTQISHRGDIV